jgi:hypothetical protein
MGARRVTVAREIPAISNTEGGVKDEAGLIKVPLIGV